MEAHELEQRIAKIEALFAGTESHGEKEAAKLALERLLDRLEKEKAKDPIVELKFVRLDPYAKKLFLALLRRYGLEPYRYYRQKWSTVMVKGPENFITNIVWEEFKQLEGVLTEHLNSVTDNLISKHICECIAEEKEIQQLEGGT